MNDKQYKKIEKHYNKLVKNKTIKTLNDALIYKKAIDKSFSLFDVGSSNKIDYKKGFELAIKYIKTTVVSMKQSKESDDYMVKLQYFMDKHNH